MAKGERLTDNEDYKKWKKMALLLFGWWVVIGTAANIPNWVSTNIKIPPEIKVATAGA